MYIIIGTIVDGLLTLFAGVYRNVGTEKKA